MIDFETMQHSPQWYKARLGNITGSKCGDLMGKPRSKTETFTETAKSYMAQIAAERTMNPAVLDDETLFAAYLEQTSIISKAMRFGNEQEDNARRLFERMAGVQVEEVSSCTHDSIEHFAASPDGLILVDLRPIACVEIKCPEQKTFVKYLDIVDGDTLKSINPTYYWQTQAEMACTDTHLCYFVVYSPWQSSPLHVAKIERNTEDVEALTERVELANEYINTLIQGHHGQQSVIPSVLREVQSRALGAAI